MTETLRMTDLATIAARATQLDSRAFLRSMTVITHNQPDDAARFVIEFRNPEGFSLFLDEALAACGRGAIYSVGTDGDHKIELEIKR
jgi:hypothetical protein